MGKTLLGAALLAALVAAAHAGQKAEEKKTHYAYVDLTIVGVQWTNADRSSAVITVRNAGSVGVAETEGSYACATQPSEKGYSFSSGAGFHVPALAAGAAVKLRLHCGGGRKVTGAEVDAGDEVKESNEKNNVLVLAGQKPAPAKRPR